MTHIYIGLGANIGEPHTALDHALDGLRPLARNGEVTVSPRYRSAPIDALGPDFINAVATFDSEQSAIEILRHLHALEAAAGRQRSYRNAPRTLDLDLLLFGDEQIASAAMTVPHPRMLQRAFVLKPLLDLAPDIHIPGAGAARDHWPAVAGQTIVPC
ncbi:MAG: 2-amino-4-hydroxy-6-hydroxymethyldihydropteridine diphosphokinase [Burkholderiaceae bacterium]|jgi:2-amino-4-hydroxy-6-hydroxymethyldihydropteridine diphosphokinase